MSTRQQLLYLIEQLSDEQIAALLPLIVSMRDRADTEAFSNEGSQAYQDWMSSENDIYDELFADDLATR